MKELYLIIWNTSAGIEIFKTFSYEEHLDVCADFRKENISFQTGLVKVPEHVLDYKKNKKEIFY